MKIISNKKLMFIIIIFYGIIGICHINYAVADFNYKVVKNSNAGPTINVAEYEICTDALMYHISANGYDKKIGDPCDDNFSIAGVGSSNSLKAKGYGWYTYKLKSLQGLIEYCHSKNPTITDDKSNITIGIEPYTVNYNYNILVNLSESSLSKTSKDVMKRFWEGMYSAIQNEFIEYQDSYFFRENTLKAIDKIRGTLNSEGLEANNLSERNLSRNRTDYPTQSKKEYLTLLTTYMYSINREEKLASVGKGDLVPFLYYAEHTDETDPYIIGKYAYIALVYEFLRVSGTNYWTAEFDRIYFNNTGFADSEIFEEYDFETLEQWYDETYEKYKNDRGVKQNPLIGSDIDTIISSNYTINYQVEATKDYVENIYADLGIDMTVDDFIAKNALMAEYMMEHSNFDDVIKDYNVSIKFVVDNLQRGTFEEKNSTTAVLSDFQTIEFDNTIEKVANQDKDSDSLTNKSELGDTKWQDITGFVEKMYVFKYGTNMTMYESKVDEMVINNGGYTDFNGNFVYGHVKKEKDLSGNIKVFYRVYDYKSNPALKDTDFDGMDDADDSRPKDGLFHGTTKIEKNQTMNVDYHNDYRHFFINNNKYNSELAEMSLMISNLANDEDRKLHIYQGGDSRGISTAGRQLIGDMNMTAYLTKIGFIPLGNISLYNNDGKCYLYYKIVNYYGEEKLIFGIFIGGFNNERAYKELVISKDDEKYQTIITNIANQVSTLKGLNTIRKYFENNKYCYWISGKNISGAIAAEVAKKIDDSSNIYCYTFAVPNINGSSTNTYIKNIVNEDDLLPKIHEGIGQDGDVYNKSIYWDLIPEYRHYVESPNKYKGNFKKTNTVKQGINDSLNSIIAWGTEEMKNIFNNDLAYYVWLNINGINETENSFFANTASNLISLNKDTDDIMTMRKYKDEVSSGNSTKAYWCLVKSLDGYDSKYYYTRDNNEVYGKKEEKVPSSDENKTETQTGYYYNRVVENALQNVGQWYVDNVYTYQAGNGKSNDDWKTEFYTKIQTKKNRGGIVALERRIGHRNEYNANRTEDQPEFLDDNENIQTRINYEDPYMNAGAEVYKWKNGYAQHGRYTTDELNKTVGSDFNQFADDCSSFTMAVLDYATRGALYRNINSINGAMYNAGNGNIKNNNYKTVITDLKFDYIPVTEAMTMDDLENGDLLIAGGHYEFVIIGEDNSGTIGNRMRTFKQFGWGNVKGVYPDLNFNITKSTNETFYDQDVQGSTRRMYDYIIRLNNDGVRVYE